jgi:hypothetical protein
MSSDEERIAQLERRVSYLIRYLGISPADIMNGVFPERDGSRPAAQAGPGDFQSAGPFPGASGLPPELYDLIRRGKLIPAIKLYRESTGAGIDEAKAAVNDIARSM